MKSIMSAAVATAILVSGGAVAKTKVKSAKGIADPGMLILYSEANYNGDTYEFVKARTQIPMEWNIGSIAVAPGESWEICEKARYKAPCVTLNRSYADTSEIGVTGMIGSLRPAAPQAAAAKAR